MKKTNKYNRDKQRGNENPPEQVKAPAKDSFQNPLARLGLGSNSLMENTQYPITRITRDYNLLNSLYRNSWVAKKVVDAIPQDMTKNWFSISAELKPKEQDRYDKLEKRTKIREKITEGLTWGRLYGGAAALILIKGQEDELEEPLVVDDILPNSFKGLMILDRWSGIYPGLELITDIDEPDFGMPEFYEIKDVDGNMKQRVHHSRIMRFTGRKLPFWEDQTEMHWGASELEHVFDELAKRDNTSWNIASLVFQANVLVNKVDGLDQMVTLTDAQAQQDYYALKTAMNQMRSNSSMMMIGKDEELTALNYSFAGLNEIYESFMMDLAGAADIPVTRLFGRSPAGMDATGESDENMYYDMIGRHQETMLKPKIDQLLPIMFMSEFGKIPDDLGIKFNPIKTPNDSEVADIVGKKVDSIAKVFDLGIINQKIAMAELHELSYNTNMFSNISDEDLAEANSSYPDDMEMGNDEDTKTDEEDGESSVQVNAEAKDNNFKEEEHPRSDNGEFGNKGGNTSNAKNKLDKPLKLKIDNGKITITGNIKVKVEGSKEYNLVKNSDITKIVPFAGKGTNKALRVAQYLTDQFGGKNNDWQHTRGQGVVDYEENHKKAELHWFNNDEVGYVKIKVKRWLK